MVSTMTNVETMKMPEGYKQTEVGVVPKGWDIVTIDHALKTKVILDQMDGNHGELYPKSHEFSDFGIPYVGATDFNNGRVDFSSCKFLPLKRAMLFKKGIAKRGDVLFAHNATVGPVALLETEFDFVILSTTATYYRCDESKVNNKYLASYFESQLFVNQYSSVMSQSTRNQVPILTQRKFKLVLPGLKEQTAIANALSDVDNLIASLETLIAKKSAIKTAAMQQLLTGKKRLPAFEGKSEKESAGKSEKQSEGASGKVADNSGETQAAKPSSEFETSSNHNTDAANTNKQQTAPSPGYKHTELGEIPEDWEVSKIDSVLSITTGSKNTQDKISDGTYPFYVRSQTIERINSYSFDGEGVLTAGDGVGTGKIFHYINGRCDIHQRVYLMHNFSNRLHGYYFYIYFKNNFYDKVMAMTAKSSVDSVRREMIADMLITLPPKEEQIAISSVLSDMDTELDALQQRLTKTQTIKQGMMQELLTGKTRLV